ncbi:hypothetical protein [Pontibacter fetidus]|uniref:Uncharacterized protein n=1 Tax=Pontibacter fetidus TaxID=2700082 RepID=A0A6B2H9N9_9BACT|nr:hypothetical protein [Pontibacter fetidus]NDK56920.1 hypothetical protein [Pontibacter fetidus]
MATVQYTKTSFQQPGRINEEAYYELRREVIKNRDFEIDPNFETFSQHFSGLLKTIVISLALALFCFGVFKDGNPMIAVGGISMMIFIFSLIRLFLEGPSFATYAKKRTEYFARMKYAIQNTSSYHEFTQVFYR